MSLTKVKEPDDILLTKLWIITTLIPEIARPIYNVYGGQDAAKTTTQKLIKGLINSDRPENLLSVSHDKREFIQQLSHKHIVFYDNLKYKINWLPEEICKAVTAGWTSVRELYTNEGDIIFDFKKRVGFNGINMIMNEPDVLRRSIIIRLESIEDKDKIDETEIYARAKELKPKLLAYIFDILSKAMEIKQENLNLKSVGMSDWAKWGEAISRAMAYPEMEFIDAYRYNITKQNELAIDTNPFAKAISLLCSELFTDIDSTVKRRFRFSEDDKFNIYRISGYDFLEELRGAAAREGIDNLDRRFPQAVNKISNQLNIIKTNLKSSGIDITTRRSMNKADTESGFIKNTMIVEIRDVPKQFKRANYDTIKLETIS